MTEGERALVERATAAVEGIDRTLARQERAFERQEKAFERQEKTFERQGKAFDRQERVLEELVRDGREERAEARRRHEQMMNRFAASERIFVAAMSEISADLRRNTERLDDMGDAIRADTRAVLAVLDRLGPAPG